MVLYSFAKINLSLIVGKKLRNRLHNIQSLACLINLRDKISIKKTLNGDKIKFTGSHAARISNKNNSISNLLDLLREKKLISNYYSVNVHKNIPVSAGLGGGTGNAFIILKHLLKNDKKINSFEKFIGNIGSDLKLFYYKQSFLKNLDKVIKLEKNYRLNFLIVHPNIKSSTKKIYSKVEKHSRIKTVSQKNFETREKFLRFILKSKNDLQSIVEKNHPIIKKILRDLTIEKGCYLSRMSGSGSTCYGLFSNEYCTKVALKSLRKKYPKFWSSIAKTI